MKYPWIGIGFGLFLLGLGALLLSSFDEVQEKINNFLSIKPVVYSSESQNENQNNEENRANQNISENNKKIAFTLYYDFECPFCKKFYQSSYTSLQKKYNDSFSFSLVPYAINPEGKSFEMGKWFICLKKEGKNSNEIIETFITGKKVTDTNNESGTTNISFIPVKKDNIPEIFHLSEEQTPSFNECVENEETISVLKQLRENARKKGVRGTPTFFIGEKKFEGNLSLKKIELEMLNALDMQ